MWARLGFVETKAGPMVMVLGSRLLLVGRLVFDFGFLSYNGLDGNLWDQALGDRGLLDKVKLHLGAVGIRSGFDLQMDSASCPGFVFQQVISRIRVSPPRGIMSGRRNLLQVKSNLS